MLERKWWTLIVVCVGIFMLLLDVTIVNVALPDIQRDLDSSFSQLQWVIDAYALSLAALVLTAGSLADLYGRRLLFAGGVLVFSLGSLLCGLSPSATFLDVARALQGVGGAIVTPLTLTILSAGVPANKRGAFIGAWSGIAGLAVAFGPLVGGAVVSGISWHWIFWLNVPIGVVLIPLALRRLDETHGPADKLDIPGLALASAGLTGVVWGLVRGNGQGWASTEIVAALTGGVIVFALFVLWELRAKEPMLPMRFFQNRVFTLANVASLLMFFGMFGSIFLLSQFFQTVQGYSPIGSGLRILPWTIMPMFIAPIAGALSDRIGGSRLMGIGLTLQAGGLASLAAVSTPTTPYWELVAPFMISGIGMAMFWAPVANVVLAAVRPEEEGQASGAQNAIRELGGVFGVAVLASVWSHYGSYANGGSFVDGMTPALWIGASIVLLGAVAAFLIPMRKRAAEAEAVEPEAVALAEAA
jgi:EmrB/QacA subfamily drug resistance transporter